MRLLSIFVPSVGKPGWPADDSVSLAMPVALP
jgi:hypothetical protein